jgi:glucosamine kinase
LSAFLVFESGATKLQWVLANKTQQILMGELPGLHPFLSSPAAWAQALTQLRSALASSSLAIPAYYYGTGCAQEEGRAKVHDYFQQYLPELAALSVATDLLACARALAQDQPAVVCILGTGSNVARYDGTVITDQRGGLGYVLGDEGSGATLGKILLQTFLYQQLPNHLHDHLAGELQLNRSAIISMLYQSDNPSRYLAGFAPLVHQWLQQAPVLQKKVTENFHLLVENCLLPLLRDAPDPVVHFSGSIAHHFQPLIAEVLASHGIRMGQVMAVPLPDLVRYHQRMIPEVGKKG